MTYKKIIQGTFIERPNRFIAMVDVDGIVQTCHVKNTGRCKEILKSGATVFLEESDNPNRKTKYSLVTVRKGERLINIDSQAPNKVVHEWLKGGGLFSDITLIKPECKHGNSRLDFYVEHGGKKAFIEVKGVTLENDGVVSFPDAPTQRGTKHMNELVSCVENGFEAYAILVVQMKDVIYFEPNVKNDPDFSEALKNAAQSGVTVLAFDCNVGENSVSMSDAVEIRL